MLQEVAHSLVGAGPCGIRLIKKFSENPNKAPDASCVEEFRSAFATPFVASMLR